MSVMFKSNNVLHNITAVFTRARLPKADKLYNLKAVNAQELDVQSIAAMARKYNMAIQPWIIEQGFNAALELMCYYIANGYIIKTPFFTVKVTFPGVYTGREKKLHKGMYPTVQIKPTRMLRDYIRKMVKVNIDGIEDTDGFISKAIDEKSGLENKTATPGWFFAIYGTGLKVEYREGYKDIAGVYFESVEDGTLIKATSIAVNKPRTLKVIVPDSLIPGTSYHLVIKTQSTKAHGSTLLKGIRIMRSEFTVSVPRDVE